MADFANLLGRLRHDLRTPAGHVIGYAEMLAEDLEDDGPEDLVTSLLELRSFGGRLVEVVEEYFGAAKKSAAELDADQARETILDLAARSREQVGTILDSAGGHREALEPDLLKIRGATEELERVLEVALPPVLEASTGGREGLPAAPGAAPPSEDEAASSSVPRISAIAEGGDILVVDDDAVNRDLISRRLRRSGYRALTAGSGTEALDVLSREHVDLVLLDLVMPEQDGQEVLREVKGHRVLQHVPVIMLSALDDMDRIVQCILEGAEDYLLKPVNPVLLSARIGASLEKHRLRQQHALRLKVFISSPSDVAPERRIVRNVIRSLNAELSGSAHLVPVLWEEEPLLASETAQTQIELPRETDIYVGIFWARFGTPLPEEVCRPDGTRYASGTEFEFEDAMAGIEERKLPDILIYRKEKEPVVSLTDRESVLRSLDQKELLEAFIRRWFTTSDGLSIAGVYHAFETEEQFTELVEGHLRKLVERRLQDAPET